MEIKSSGWARRQRHKGWDWGAVRCFGRGVGPTAGHPGHGLLPSSLRALSPSFWPPSSLPLPSGSAWSPLPANSCPLAMEPFS